MKLIAIIVIAFVVLIPQAFAELYPDLGVKVETIAENLSIPWSLEFAILVNLGILIGQ